MVITWHADRGYQPQVIDRLGPTLQRVRDLLDRQQEAEA